MFEFNSLVVQGNIDAPIKVKKTTKEDPYMKCVIPFVMSHFVKNEYGEDVNEITHIDVYVLGPKVASCVKAYKVGDTIRVLGRLKEVKLKTKTGEIISKIAIIAREIDQVDMDWHA